MVLSCFGLVAALTACAHRQHVPDCYGPNAPASAGIPLNTPLPKTASLDPVPRGRTSLRSESPMSKLMTEHGDCSIEGRVVQARTRAPLAGITTVLMDSGGLYRTALSDSSGLYRFTDLPCGAYHLTLFYGDVISPLDITVPRGGVAAPTVEMPEHQRPLLRIPLPPVRPRFDAT